MIPISRIISLGFLALVLSTMPFVSLAQSEDSSEAIQEKITALSLEWQAYK